MEEGRQIWEFDLEFDRKSTCDLKWRKEGVMAYLNQKVQEDMIPMWIADTDFGCMEEIVETLKARAAHGIYGYCSTTPKFEERIAFWEQQRFGRSVLNGSPPCPRWSAASILPSALFHAKETGSSYRRRCTILLWRS